MRPPRLPAVFNFSGSEIVFLLLLALIILGPEKLPEAVRKFAKTYGEFKKVTTGFQSELKQVLDEPMREMRETADAFKKAATLDIDTSAFTDPFGKAVSSADQRSVTAEEQTDRVGRRRSCSGVERGARSRSGPVRLRVGGQRAAARVVAAHIVGPRSGCVVGRRRPSACCCRP